MKKFFVMILFCMMIFPKNADCLKRGDNPFHNNPDYEFVYIYSSEYYEINCYLYIPSLKVLEYNPPYYKISGKLESYYGNYKEYSVEKPVYITRIYNWDTKETFCYNKDYKRWEKDDTKNYISRKMDDALFRVAYGIDFYGY